MTPLRKKVKRKTVGAYSVLYREPRHIVVNLLPGDVLEFREAGRRAKFQLAIDTAFRYAVRLHVAAERSLKREARKKK